MLSFYRGDSMKKLGCGALLFLLFIVILIPVIGNSTGDSKKENQGLASSLGITEENAKTAETIFEQVGLSEYKKIVHDEMLDNAHIDGEKGYRLETKDVKNIIVYIKPDETVNIIRYADNDLYSEGKVKAKISDFLLTDMEIASLQTQSENAIKSLLKAPSTAKFPNISEWRFSKTNNATIIQSYVDSQNSFGAMLRSEFQIKIENEKVTSLILDGTEYIKN